jgi:hypothetical protein
MPDPIIQLSRESIEKLQRLLTLVDQDRFNTGLRSQYPEPPLPRSPDVFIALPQTVVPVLTRIGTGSGSVDSPMEGDQPGSAVCDVYQLINGAITAVSRQQTLYNLSATNTIPVDWILVIRDKFGSWFPAAGSGGSSSNGTTIWTGVAQENIAMGGYGLVNRDSTGLNVSVFAELGSITSGSICYVGEYIDGVQKIINSQCAMIGTGT